MWFYSIDTKYDLGTLDIKIYLKARGKGIGRSALDYAINEVFVTENCSRVYVDPDRVNVKAWALYEKIGFKEVKIPKFLEPSDFYLELSKENFNIE